MSLSQLYLSESLKLYITQVVVESAVGDRKPEATLNRQVFMYNLNYTVYTVYIIFSSSHQNKYRDYY